VDDRKVASTVRIRERGGEGCCKHFIGGEGWHAFFPFSIPSPLPRTTRQEGEGNATVKVDQREGVGLQGWLG
jgi:hypothetical protein